MPMFGSRYHMNPAMGQALEEARSAPDGPAQEDTAGNEQEGDAARDESGRFTAPGVVHHMDIRRAHGGFIALVQRHSGSEAVSGAGQGVHPSQGITSQGVLGGVAHDVGRANGPGALPGFAAGRSPSGLWQSPPEEASGATPEHGEVHVFTSHRELMTFLRTELGRR